MTTPAKVKRNMIAAKWLYPDGEWRAKSSGIVSSNKYGDFDLEVRRDRDSVLIKLKAMHGWTVTINPDSDGDFRATKAGLEIKMPVLSNLIVDVIERIQGER